MSTGVLSVRAPSRLNFGLMSFGPEGRENGLQFGCVGAMIESPSLCLELSQSDQFEVVASLPEHAVLIKRLAAAFCGSAECENLHCRIVLRSAPGRQFGLGSGTQLALSVITGLSCFHGMGRPSVDRLVKLTGRGKRSGIGCHGFFVGGIIRDFGKTFHDGKCEESLSPLADRAFIPPHWRFVLIRPTAEESGLSGQAERSVFEQLAVDQQLAAMLRAEAEECMMPAVKQGRFEFFAESLYRYNHLAGLCYKAVQTGGAYRNERLSALVAMIRKAGLHGVGQSSWGPTIFVAVNSEHTATELVEWLRRKSGWDDLELQISRPNNCGARIH